MSSVRSVSFGSLEIAYDLTFARRRRLSITVHPDLRVEVVAPEGKTVDEVERRIRARRSWIARHLRELSSLHPLPSPRRWISGESHWYLGRQYRLTIHSGEPKVWRAGGRIHVRVNGRASPRAVRDAMRDWYTGHAREVLRERIDRVRSEHPRLARLNPRVRILWMKKRWGSCGSRGIISLNAALVKVPVSSIDYLIVHELCHLIEPRHSKRFYSILGNLVPDWERRREHLSRPRG